jgi:energy-coupling factor transporter ATP-binding protein EcfA2
LTQFAADLRRLREKAGSPPYRELARRAHYSAGTLSDAAGGRKLPSLSVALAYVRACDGDIAEWESRWHAVAEDISSAEDGVEDTSREPSPYVGLVAFQPEDSGRFHGREALTDALVSEVRDKRFVAVLGASGVGKSSLLRAGLVARLRASSRGPVLVCTPGAHPFQECAVALAARTGQPPAVLAEELRADPHALRLRIRAVLHEQSEDTDVVLVIDQFEELFTLCDNENERAAFIAALVDAGSAKDTRTRIVIGARLDFYPQLTAYPELVPLLQDGQLLVGPMTTDELRAAIVQPASEAGYVVEGALLATIVADAVGRPGALPLVSHALVETWRHRRGTTLTLAGYQSVGGITHSIARTAEAVYTGLDGVRQRLAKNLFLRMISPGEDTGGTKRRIPRHELDAEDTDLDVVLERLVTARLITVDSDGIDIGHEALIQHWPRLRDWLATDRDSLRVHRQLTEATDTWEALDHDDGALYRGARLAAAEEWAPRHGDELTGRERGFLTASSQARDAELRLGQHRTRVLRQLLALMTVLLVASVCTTWYALHTRSVALDAERAVTAQRDIAAAEYAAGQIPGLLAQNQNTLALALAQIVCRLDPTVASRGELLDLLASAEPSPATTVTGPGQPSVSTLINGREFGGLRMVEVPGSRPGASDLVGLTGTFGNAARMWGFSASTDVVPEDQQYQLGGASASATDSASVYDPAPAPVAYPVVFSGRSHLLGINDDGAGQLWDFADPNHPRMLSTLTGREQLLALSPDGHTLATLGEQTTVTVQGVDPVNKGRASYDDAGAPQLWDVRDPNRPRLLVNLDQIDQQDLGGTNGMVFSPDGSQLATTDTADTIRLWDVSAPATPKLLRTFQVGLGATIAFTPDGRRLIAVEYTDYFTIWDLASAAEIAQAGADNSALSDGFALSPDGRYLATQTTGDITQLWDLADPANPVQFGRLSGTVAPVAFAPDGHTLIVLARGNVLEPRETDVGLASADACRLLATKDPFLDYEMRSQDWAQYFPGIPYQPTCSPTG